MLFDCRVTGCQFDAGRISVNDQNISMLMSYDPASADADSLAVFVRASGGFLAPPFAARGFA